MLNNYSLYCSQRDVGGLEGRMLPSCIQGKQLQLHIILMVLSSGLTANRLIIAALPLCWDLTTTTIEVKRVTSKRGKATRYFQMATFK